MTESTDLSNTATKSRNYVGRFAPSPTGPLHMGSLMAALASYLDARSKGGKWLVRMEDLDPPRETKEAADQILFALEKCHLFWDEQVLYQSKRYPAYQEAIETLTRNDLVFACDCSRQQLQEFDGIYPGTCRARNLENSDTALRVKVSNQHIRFTDLIQNEQSQNLEKEVGDFVIRRKDGLYAYQLAVVIDDAFQGITHVVRGIDLIDSTARQIYLQQQLNLSPVEYAHIPVIVNSQGQKLSKQHRAEPIPTERPSELLIEALAYLQQAPVADLASASPDEILDWGIQHWQPGKMLNLTEIEEH